MPRMSNLELIEIIDERLPQIGLRISDQARRSIVDISQGFPGFVHLAGRESALSSIGRRSRNIEMPDYQHALMKSVRKAHESIVNTYHKAIYSARENIYKEVLLACALTKRDERGQFSAKSVKEPLSEILKKPVEIANFARHLSAFCNDDRGPVLRKTGKPKRFQYQFINAPLQPYIIMAGKNDNLI